MLRQVAAWPLPGALAIDRLADRDQAMALVGLASDANLLGPLLSVIDDGALSLPDDLVADATARHEAAMLWCLTVEQRLLDVRRWFEDAGGVEHLVIKGPAVAYLDNDDPSLRFFADLDLLIHRRDMDRALAAMVEHDAVRRLPERRPGFDRRFVKSVGLTCPDGVELDVHRTLCGGALGFRIPLDRIFVAPDSFVLGDQEAAAPIELHRALHAAYHAMLGTHVPPLRTIRDLAGYLCSPGLDPEMVGAEAGIWGGQVVLAEAVAAVLQTLPLEAPAWSAWLSEADRNPRELTLIARSRVPSTWPVEWSMLRELSWVERGAFLWAFAVPSSQVLEMRGQTASQRVRQGLHQTWSRLRRRMVPR